MEYEDDEPLCSEEEAAEAYKQWFWEKAVADQEQHYEFMRVVSDMRRKEIKECGS